jgi:UDP-N-acetylglucosamine--N-acetylmuramyl-(pentapeptide) pyrophosphoryl-undecaprenol N-acetylglucosamine transferase
MHLLICSGGTGGHFYPALSIAREYASRGGKVTLLISGQQVREQREQLESEGLQLHEIPSVRVPHGIGAALCFPFRFWKCKRALDRLFRELDADALLSMGSFTSVAPCFSWKTKHGPLMLHEGNTFMGQANRLFVKKAKHILLSLPLANDAQRKGTPATVVGMPLRQPLLDAAKDAEDPAAQRAARERLGLDSEKTTLLVFGGSQGARAITDLLTKTIPLLTPLAQQLQLICLTGAEDNHALESACRNAGIQARIRQRDLEIQHCYLAADAVLCRAGASSICELALLKKAALLIPLPSAKDNHQYHNAKLLADDGAARLLVQSETTPETLAGLLQEWLRDPAPFRAMGKKLGGYACPDATKKAVDVIESCLAERP